MGTRPNGETPTRPPQTAEDLPGIEAPIERLVCLYLRRVPAASARDIQRDLRLDAEALTPALYSLIESGHVEKQRQRYVIAGDRRE